MNRHSGEVIGDVELRNVIVESDDADVPDIAGQRQIAHGAGGEDVVDAEDRVQMRIACDQSMPLYPRSSG